MFTSVGKKQMIDAMITFGRIPMPKIRTMIGAMARTGIVLRKSTTGK